MALKRLGTLPARTSCLEIRRASFRAEYRWRMDIRSLRRIAGLSRLLNGINWHSRKRVNFTWEYGDARTCLRASDAKCWSKLSYLGALPLRPGLP